MKLHVFYCQKRNTNRNRKCCQPGISCIGACLPNNLLNFTVRYAIRVHVSFSNYRIGMASLQASLHLFIEIKLTKCHTSTMRCVPLALTATLQPAASDTLFLITDKIEKHWGRMEKAKGRLKSTEVHMDNNRMILSLPRLSTLRSIIATLAVSTRKEMRKGMRVFSSNIAKWGTAVQMDELVLKSVTFLKSQWLDYYNQDP